MEDATRQPARVRARRTAAFVAIAMCIAFAVYVHTTVGFDIDPRSLRARIDAFGWWAPAAYVVAASLRLFLGLPSGIVMSAGGLLFGVVGGFVWSLIGFSASAVLSFALARGLGRDAVATRLRGRAEAIDAAISRRGAPWMALYTAVPVSVLSPVQMAAGLSGLALGSFFVASVAGLVPRIALYSFFGDAIAQGRWGAVAVAGGVIVVAGVLGSFAARRFAAARAGARTPSNELSKDVEGSGADQ